MGKFASLRGGKNLKRSEEKKTRGQRGGGAFHLLIKKEGKKRGWMLKLLCFSKEKKAGRNAVLRKGNEHKGGGNQGSDRFQYWMGREEGNALRSKGGGYTHSGGLNSYRSKETQCGKGDQANGGGSYSKIRGGYKKRKKDAKNQRTHQGGKPQELFWNFFTEEGGMKD